MKTENGWQGQMEQLGRVLSERPRLASRVLQQIAEQCEPACDRSDAPDVVHHGRGKLRWLAAGFSTLAAGLLLAFWILGSTGTLAFAEVQAALLEIKTAIIERQVPDAPNLKHRVLVSSKHDLFRIETGSGAVVIQSREGKTLLLNAQLRIAHIMAGAGFGLDGEDQSPQDLLSSLQNVQTNAVKSLGKQVFDGRELAGFELPAGYQSRRTMWVDPESRLPVREEITSLDQDPSADGNSLPSVRTPRVEVTYRFNVELSDELFALDPPEGYTLVSSDEFQMQGFELPSRPADFESADYLITPGQGIGRVRFGMTKQEVVAVLGEPDSAEQFGGLTEQQQKEMDELEKRAADENWGRFRYTREMNRIVRAGKTFVRAGEALFFRSLGFSVTIRDDTGVQGFTCSHRTGVFQMFGGATDRRISMNSTLADVKRVYGEPTSTFEPEGLLIVVFKEMGLNFTFGSDGKMREIGVNRIKTQ